MASTPAVNGRCIPAWPIDALRISFWIIWLIDATLKWLPVFRSGYMGMIMGQADGQPGLLVLFPAPAATAAVMAGHHLLRGVGPGITSNTHATSAIRLCPFSPMPGRVPKFFTRWPGALVRVVYRRIAREDHHAGGGLVPDSGQAGQVLRGLPGRRLGDDLGERSGPSAAIRRAAEASRPAL